MVATDGNPNDDHDVSAAMVRLHDGHMGYLVHGHAEARPIILFDEVAHDGRDGRGQPNRARTPVAVRPLPTRSAHVLPPMHRGRRRCHWVSWTCSNEMRGSPWGKLEAPWQWEPAASADCSQSSAGLSGRRSARSAAGSDASRRK